MDATVLLTVNIMDNIFTIERCVPRSSRSGSRSRRSGSAMAKMSRRAISDKMYKADVEVRQESKTRCSMASFDVLKNKFGNGQDQVQ